MRNFTSNKNKQIIVGVWKFNSLQTGCCVWFDSENMPQSLILENLDESVIREKIRQTFPSSKAFKLKFVTAILPHNIFLKSVILPHDLSPEEVEAQCIITLEEHLPLPLNEVWFDFIETPLPQNQQLKNRRIDIFAIVKEVAIKYVNTFEPLNIQVLDCVINALLRGFQYLYPVEEEEKYNTLYLYCDDDYVILLSNQPQNWLFQSKKRTDPLALITSFLQQHTFSAKHIIVYDCAKTPTHYPKDYHLTSNHYPLIALGCALWAGEETTV